MLILFGFTVIIIVLIKFSNTRNKDSKKESEEFWRKEHDSRFVPRKDISKLEYLTIEYSKLPFRYWMPGTDGEPVSLANSTSDVTFLDNTADFDNNPDESKQEEEFESTTYVEEVSLPDGTHQSSDMAPMQEEISATEYDICRLSDKKILNLSGITNTELRMTYGTANLDPLSAADQNFTSLIRSLQKWGNLLVSTNNLQDAVTVLSYAVSIGSDITGTYALLGRLYKGMNQFDKINELKASAEKLNTLLKPSIIKDLNSLLEISEVLNDILE